MRKLSLNKFRLSSEQQETRHTPEGGDSSRSQSQSPQESPVHPNEPIKKQGDDNVPEREKGAKGELKKPEKLLEKPSKTVTIVQHTTPSVIIKSFVQQGEPCTDTAGITDKICKLKTATIEFRSIQFLTINTSPFCHFKTSCFNKLRYISLDFIYFFFFLIFLLHPILYSIFSR